MNLKPLLVGLMLALCLGVQEQPGVETEDATILQPGDKLLVQVWGEDIPNPVFSISPGGMLVLTPYYIGSVPAAGRTLAQVREEILRRLKALYKDPQVTVSIVEYSPRRTQVYVFGEVEKPGAYSVSWGATVLDAIGQAGGLKASADPSRATLVRPGGSILTVDLSRLIFHGDQSQNVELKPGDTLVVPRGTVLVLGAVKQPGQFPIAPDLRVVNLLQLAGGLQEQADPRNARILRRDGLILHVDLWALLNEGQAQQNLPVEAGDIFFVPEAGGLSGVLILGDVKAPGLYPHRPGMTILQALTLAGGYAEGVTSAAGRVVRKGETKEVDVDRLLREGDLSQNVPLEAGDVVVIRQGERRALLVGEVEKPGIYALPSGATVLQLLALGGNLSPRADLSQVQILRRGQRLVANLEQVLKEGKVQEDQALEPGDVVVVPRKDRWQVVVLGHVKEPGPHIWQEGETLQVALRTAGGPVGAGSYRAIVSRADGSRQEANLDALFLKGDLSQDLPLRPGDLVLVQPAGDEVWVLGRVRQPGRHLLQPRETLLEALALAGGVEMAPTTAPWVGGPRPVATPQIERLEAVISRQGKVLTADLYALLYEGKLTENHPIQAGDLIIVRSQGSEITVIGAVLSPGTHPYQERERLLSAITYAGGLLPEADWENITVTRRGERLVVSLNRLQEGDLSQNLELQPGDIVTVPEAKRVIVYGEVAKPGSYPLERRLLLMDLLTAAGGMTERADLAHVTLFRGSQVLKADLLKMQEKGDASDNFPLQSGDRVFVPPRGEVLVFGAALKPGFYPVTPDLTLLRLVSQAGYGPESNLRGVTVIRLPEGESVPVTLYADVQRMMDTGDLTQNVQIQPRDIVYIPRRGERKITWMDITRMLYDVGVFLSILGVRVR